MDPVDFVLARSRDAAPWLRDAAQNLAFITVFCIQFVEQLLGARHQLELVVEMADVLDPHPHLIIPARRQVVLVRKDVHSAHFVDATIKIRHDSIKVKIYFSNFHYQLPILPPGSLLSSNFKLSA